MQQGHHILTHPEDFSKLNRMLLWSLAVEVGEIVFSNLIGSHISWKPGLMQTIQASLVTLLFVAFLLNLGGFFGTVVLILSGLYRGHRISDWLGHVLNGIFVIVGCVVLFYAGNVVRD